MFKLYILYEMKLSYVCSRILTDFWVNYIISYSVSYSFYSQLQLVCWVIESHCVKKRRHFNKNWQLTFWIDFLISILIIFNQYFNWFLNFDQYFDWFVTDALIFLTSVQAVMNDIWLRLSQNSDEQSQLTLSCAL